jgi:hypothetical protein
MRSSDLRFVARFTATFLVLFSIGCGGGTDAALPGSELGGGGAGATGEAGGAAGLGGGGAGAPGTGGGVTPASDAGKGGSVDASDGSTRESAAQGGSDTGSPIVYPPGPPGCGFAQAAFCETFDAPKGATTRAGDLDPAKWSAARMCEIGAPSANGAAVPIGPGTVPTCRAGLPAQVFPSSDALVCDGNANIQSNHLLVVVAAQNYGQNSYRIRQPFDFADRTGTIVFDAQGHNLGNHGWISVEVTEDPTPAPSFTVVQNFENGAIPRNAVEIQLLGSCGGDNVGISTVFVYDDFVQKAVLSDPRICAPAGLGKLNHFEVRLSRTRVEISATPASDDGLVFGAPVVLGAVDIALPFTRGYVHLTTHNHATLKYSNGSMDAWTARWDNVGFDGPAVTGAFRENEALDSLTQASGGKINVGWRLSDVASGPAQTIEIRGVDLAGVLGARLALENWSYHAPGGALPTDFALNYRLNAKAWKARTLTASELQMMVGVDNAGTRALMLDVDVADLAQGTNTLELTTTKAPPGDPPVALNIDLILKTN